MREIKPRQICIIRYVNSQGRRCAKGDKGARKVKERSETWYATLPGTKKPVSLHTTDLGEAWIRLRKMQRETRLAAAGITDSYLEHAEATWTSHVDDWLAVVRSRNISAQQVYILGQHVSTIRQLAGWERITEISSSSAQTALGRLQHEMGRSAQTRNHYLSHLKQFVRWLVEDERLRSNPILSLDPVSVEMDRRHDRRSPTDEEIGKLMAYLASDRAKVRARMTGLQRALGYKVAMATGYRAQEIRSLARENIDLDAGQVTVVAGYSKRRRVDIQQIPPWLVEQLREWFAAGGGLWGTFPEVHPGRILKADLDAAGVLYQIPGLAGEPLFFDFHSLRHYYVTQIANTSGISPKVMMELCRHSDPKLTLKIYARVNQEELKRVVDQFPEPGKGGSGQPSKDG